KTIFVNKNQYEAGEITEDILFHELVHARQNHSLDILFIELLKTISWFNPLLYLYKTAIQLNHEYIADDKVLASGTDIADYQTLLLQTRTSKTENYLSTSFNFKTTKKRFKMMAKNDITSRSYLKFALIIPLFLVLGVTFGCNPMSHQKHQQKQPTQQNKVIYLKMVNSNTVKIDGKTIPFSNAEAVLTNIY